MNTTSGHGERAWKTLLAIAMAITLTLAGFLAVGQPASASSNDFKAELSCPSSVTEGDNARVQVRITDHKSRGYESVFWYTDIGTAARSDFESLYGLFQEFNSSEHSNNRLYRNISTTEDIYPELDETFSIRIGNKNNKASASKKQCTVTINNDDGVGIYSTEITSVPSNGYAYAVGDTITVKMWATEPIRVNPWTEIDIRVGNQVRAASLSRGAQGNFGEVYGAYQTTNWMEFEYVVQTDDVDGNGVSVPDGSASAGFSSTLTGVRIVPEIWGGPRHLTSITDDYRGLPTQSTHRVNVVEADLSIISSPASGDTYKVGETIEIKMSFNRTFGRRVAAEGSPYLEIWLGEKWAAAPYLRPYVNPTSGSLVFGYTVRAGDNDTDGLSTGSYINNDGALVGIGGSGSIRFQYATAPIGVMYSAGIMYGAIDNASQHKLNGNVTLRIISSPAGGGNTYRVGEVVEFSMPFGVPVKVAGDRHLDVWVGTGDAAGWGAASYLRGSGTATLVFGYRVQPGDTDADGIALAGSYTGDNGALRGMGGSGSIKFVDTNSTVHTTFSRISSAGEHKINGTINLQIVSSPASGDIYSVGETVEISMPFGAPVKVDGSIYMDVWVGVGNNGTWGQASYLRGSGTNTLVFGYRVRPTDRDADGIQAGSYTDNEGILRGMGGSGSIKYVTDDRVVRPVFRITSTGRGQLIDGNIFLDIVSSPSIGDTYQVGEIIEFSMPFGAPVKMDGSRYIDVWIGSGDTARWEAAPYLRGSGTNTLVFGYRVRPGDSDTDGITAGSYTSEGILRGTGGSGSIKYVDNSSAVQPVFSLPSSERRHTINGSISLLIVSRPFKANTYRYGESVEIAMIFGVPVEMEGDGHLNLKLGTGDGASRQAPYLRGSGTDMLVFGYTVKPEDRDDNGITVEGSYVDDDDVLQGVGGSGSISYPNVDGSVTPVFTGVTNSADNIIDGRPIVTVLGVAPPPSRPSLFALGEVIQVETTFDQPVDASASATATLELSTSDSTREATYASGSGTEKLIFHYTVQADDKDDNGVSVSIPANAAITASKSKTSVNFLHNPQGIHFRVQNILGAMVDGSLAPATPTPTPTPAPAPETNATEANEDATLALEISPTPTPEATATPTPEPTATPTPEPTATPTPEPADETAPEFVSAETSPRGNQVIVTFSENIGPPDLLRQISTLLGIDLGLFYAAVMDVEVDNGAFSPIIESGSISGTELTLSLETFIFSGEAVRVRYSNIFANDAPGLFVDDAGNPLATFQWQEVLNLSPTRAPADKGNPIFPAHVVELKIPEGESGAVSLVAAYPVVRDTTVTVVPFPNSEKVTVTPLSFTITPANWSDTRTFHVTTEQDNDQSNFWVYVKLEYADGYDRQYSNGFRVLVVDDDGQDDEDGV